MPKNIAASLECTQHLEMRGLIVYFRDGLMIRWCLFIQTMFFFHVSCIITFYCCLSRLLPLLTFTSMKRERCNMLGSFWLLIREKVVISLKTFPWHQKAVRFLHDLILQVERCMFIQYCGELSSCSFLNIHRKRTVKRWRRIKINEIKMSFQTVLFLEREKCWRGEWKCCHVVNFGDMACFIT